MWSARSGRSSRALALAALALAALGAGCGTTGLVEKDADRPLSFAPWTPVAKEYRFRPGDELDVRVLYNPEFSDRVVVGPDGRFSLSLIGTIMAEGRTAHELSTHIQELFGTQLRRPETVVVGRLYASQRVFVGGEVVQPGIFTMPGRIGPLEAILLAGGFRDTARPSEVALIRRGADGRPMLRSLNVAAMMARGDPEQDLPLEAFDILFVPRSTIAEIGRFVDLYINRVLPFDRALSFGFNYDVRRQSSSSSTTSTTVQ
jgi:protein involved in polysaccharide export with SLBB domain